MPFESRVGSRGYFDVLVHCNPMEISRTKWYVRHKTKPIRNQALDAVGVCESSFAVSFLLNL